MRTEYDLVSHVVRFCRSLREHGSLVGPSETADAVHSLSMVDLMDREQVYWALRTILVSRVEEAEVFDERFRRFWTFRCSQDGAPPSNELTQAGGLRSFPRHTVVVADDGKSAAGPPLVQIERTGASPVEVAARQDLAGSKREELAAVTEIAARIIRSLSSRPGRRRRRHRHKGVLDLRSAFRMNLSHGGDLITLPRRRRIPRTSRLLMLLDVSGSMDRHSELLLQLVYALGQRARHVETFVFSTSLTRVTRQLQSPSFGEALRRIGELVRHWSGGTRIGECLATLNREYGVLLDRDTWVLLISDGWETGDADRLAREMAKLRRQARRVVWLNPLLGTPDYAPLTLGLQAARPYVDTFASALDLEQLKRLPRLLTG